MYNGKTRKKYGAKRQCLLINMLHLQRMQHMTRLSYQTRSYTRKKGARGPGDVKRPA